MSAHEQERRHQARCVVEAFAALREQREPSFEGLPEHPKPVKADHAVHREARFSHRTYETEVIVDEVSYDERGLAKVMCHGQVGDTPIAYDLPIYIVGLRPDEDIVVMVEDVLIELAQEANPDGGR